MRPGRLGRTALAVLAALALSGAFPALADPVDEAPSAGDPDFVGGRKAVEAKDWPTAIRLLSSAALRDTRNADIQNYLKKGSVLYNSGATDLLGYQYSGGTFSVDSLPKLSSSSFSKLSDVAPSDFWSPFY